MGENRTAHVAGKHTIVHVIVIYTTILWMDGYDRRFVLPLGRTLPEPPMAAKVKAAVYVVGFGLGPWGKIEYGETPFLSLPP